jgi:hypothetical protein
MGECSSPVRGAAGHVRLAPATARHPGSRTLPGAAGFWTLAGLFLVFFFASAAVSPPYPAYQGRSVLATPSQRTGLVTAAFAVGYLGFSGRPLRWRGPLCGGARKKLIALIGTDLC